MYFINPYFDLYSEIQAQPKEFQLALRKKLIWAFSWAVPSNDVIEAIAKFSPIVELGAGTGYWAWLLEQAGTKVHAFDREYLNPPHWTIVNEGTPESLNDYSKEYSLLLCWPPFEEPMALQALKQFRGMNVIYVGEFRGRTGDNDFHLELETKYAISQQLEIPTWPGFSDKVFFFKRK